MADDLLRYDLLIDSAFRGVVRETLGTVAKNGLPGKHHFHINFATGYPGVRIPNDLRQKYPEDMTIVLQRQFWDLDVGKENFGVTLSFDKAAQHICIPFKAINAFSDPSVNFSLQFEANRNNPPPSPETPLGGPESERSRRPIASQLTFEAYRQRYDRKYSNDG